MATAVNCSVKKAFALIEVACRPNTTSTLGQIAAEVDMPVPTVHRLIQTLKLVGAVSPVRGGGYRLGESLVNIGVEWSSIIRSVHEIVSQHLQDFAQATGLSAQVALFDSSEHMVRIVCSESPAGCGPVKIQPGRYEAYFLAIGQILLANLPRDEILDYLMAGPFEQITDKTVTDPTLLLAKLTQIARLGFALERGEFSPGVWSLAIPVADDAENVVAAVGTCGMIDGVVRPPMAVLSDLQRLSDNMMAELAMLPTGVRSLFTLN